MPWRAAVAASQSCTGPVAKGFAGPDPVGIDGTDDRKIFRQDDQLGALGHRLFDQSMGGHSFRFSPTRGPETICIAAIRQFCLFIVFFPRDGGRQSFLGLPRLPDLRIAHVPVT
jgi:hypothetical protein